MWPRGMRNSKNNLNLFNKEKVAPEENLKYRELGAYTCQGKREGAPKTTSF